MRNDIFNFSYLALPLFDALEDFYKHAPLYRHNFLSFLKQDPVHHDIPCRHNVALAQHVTLNHHNTTNHLCIWEQSFELLYSVAIAQAPPDGLLLSDGCEHDMLLSSLWGDYSRAQLKFFSPKQAPCFSIAPLVYCTGFMQYRTDLISLFATSVSNFSSIHFRLSSASGRLLCLKFIAA